jgi:hypothetical protein
MPIEKPSYEFLDVEFQPGLFDVDLPTEAKASNTALSFDEVRCREHIAISAFTAQLREIVLMSAQQRETKGFGGVPAYYEVFLDLLDGGWPPRVAAYIAWASSPRLNRWPKTQDELAQLLGLTSDRQFTKWRRNNTAIDNLIAKLQIEPLLKHRADVFSALIESASAPDYKNHPDRRLFTEITGDYVPLSKLEAEMKRSSGKSQIDEREERIIEDILNPKIDGNERS